MRWPALLAALSAALFVAGGAKAWADSDDDAATAAHPAARLTIRDGVTTITLTAAEQQSDGIATVHVPAAPMHDLIAAYGTVLDATALTEQYSQHVAADNAMRAAEAKRSLAQAAYERAKVLHRDAQNVSAAQVQAAESEFEVSQAALASARAQQETIATQARQQWGDVIGSAIIDGTQLLSELVTRHYYLVRVTLPPGETPHEPAATATARTADGSELHLSFVSPAGNADRGLQGLSYFYRLPAQPGVLPGLRFDVSLTDNTTSRGAVVPESAIVWLQGKAWIYRQTAAGTFERDEILPDRMAAHGGYIVPDLAAGTEVVARGAQMLLSEEFRAQAPIED